MRIYPLSQANFDGYLIFSNQNEIRIGRYTLSKHRHTWTMYLAILSLCMGRGRRGWATYQPLKSSHHTYSPCHSKVTNGPSPHITFTIFATHKSIPYFTVARFEPVTLQYVNRRKITVPCAVVVIKWSRCLPSLRWYEFAYCSCLLILLRKSWLKISEKIREWPRSHPSHPKDELGFSPGSFDPQKPPSTFSILVYEERDDLIFVLFEECLNYLDRYRGQRNKSAEISKWKIVFKVFKRIWEGTLWHDPINNF